MQRVFYRLTLFVLLCVLVLGACQGGVKQSPTPTPPAGSKTPVAQTSPLAASESPLSAAVSPLAAAVKIAKGKAAVSGRLFSQNTGEPLNHEIVRLADLECPEGTKEENKVAECFWALSNAFSPSTFTDPTGYFLFLDVEAREYVLLVGDMIGKYALMKNDQDQVIIIEAVADQLTDVGEHQLNY